MIFAIFCVVVMSGLILVLSIFLCLSQSGGDVTVVCSSFSKRSLALKGRLTIRKIQFLPSGEAKSAYFRAIAQLCSLLYCSQQTSCGTSPDGLDKRTKK